MKQFLISEEERIRSFKGDEVALEYRGRVTSALTGEEKASMRVGDVVSHDGWCLCGWFWCSYWCVVF